MAYGADGGTDHERSVCELTTFACIATVPERRAYLEKAVASLLPQVDELHVHQNHEWGALPGDSGKFSKLGLVDCEYYLTCDDDLIYPFDYVEKITDFCWQYDAVVSAHGRVYYEDERPESFTFGKLRKYNCTALVDEVAYVHVTGTGVTCIPRRLHEPIRATMPEIVIPNASDLYLAVALKRLNERAIVMPHAENWLRTELPPDARTIDDEVRKGDESVQIEMLAEVLGYATV